MSDIVERLNGARRKLEAVAYHLGLTGITLATHDRAASACEDAAAEITRLQADLKEAVASVADLAELLKVIKEHWCDYDHVYSEAVQDAAAIVEKHGGAKL